MAARHVAIDIGASSGRAIVGELVDGHLKLTEVYRFDNGLIERNGHRCWDIDALADHVVEGLRAAHEQGLTPQTVGIDTWAVDYVLLDQNGQRVSDAVAYRDARTEGVREELEAAGTLSFVEHYERTGIQFQRFNTAYQLVAHKREHPEDFERAAAFLMIPDYLNYVLTGVSACEYTNASTTALVGAQSRDWDDELIERLGLSPALFPKICEPGTTLGTLTPAIQERVGFDCTVVLPATHDTGSAWLAVPAQDPAAAYLSSGTWSLLGSENRQPVTSAASMQANFTNEGGAYGTYRYLKNIMGMWMVQSVRRELGPRADGKLPSFDTLIDEAFAARGDFPRLDVDADRFLAPASMVDEVRAACTEAGGPVPQTPGELVRCIYDSLAADYAQAIAQLGELTGTPRTCVNIVGGGSQNRYMNQATANACGIPVYAGPTEGTALGNIMVQLIAAGEVENLAAARALIRDSFDIKVIEPQR